MNLPMPEWFSAEALAERWKGQVSLDETNCFLVRKQLKYSPRVCHPTRPPGMSTSDCILRDIAPYIFKDEVLRWEKEYFGNIEAPVSSADTCNPDNQTTAETDSHALTLNR